MYLLDYGLAYRYLPDGKHIPYKEDPKRRHDGTIEYTSMDAHRGCGESQLIKLSEVLGLIKTFPSGSLYEPNSLYRDHLELLNNFSCATRNLGNVVNVNSNDCK